VPAKRTVPAKRPVKAPTDRDLETAKRAIRRFERQPSGKLRVPLTLYLDPEPVERAGAAPRMTAYDLPLTSPFVLR